MEPIKKPLIKYVEKIIPQYKLVQEELKVPKVVEVPVEGISQKDLDLIKQYGAALSELYEKIKLIKNYKIQEEVLRVKVPEFEKKTIIEPEFIKKTITEKEYIKVQEEIKIPRLKEIPVEGISKEDLQLIREMVLSFKELKKELDALRHYKLKEEFIQTDKVIFKPKTVEIEKEQVNWIVSDVVIDSVEDLLKQLKAKKAK